jgi:hypothetical protein
MIMDDDPWKTVPDDRWWDWGGRQTPLTEEEIKKWDDLVAAFSKSIADTINKEVVELLKNYYGT